MRPVMASAVVEYVTPSKLVCPAVAAATSLSLVQGIFIILFLVAPSKDTYRPTLYPSAAIV